MGQYGLMPQRDMKSMDEALLLTCKQFEKVPVIRVLEIGVHQGNTSRGIRDELKRLGYSIEHTGIDNQRDFKMGAPFPESRLIIGDSMTSYTKVPDNYFHFGFIDGNHSYPMTMIDHLLYSDKIVDGGFLLFHDTGAHIQPMVDFQGIGDMADPDMYIACRKAIKKLGLLDNTYPGWVKVFDQWSTELHTGGMFLIRKSTRVLYDDYMSIP